MKRDMDLFRKVLLAVEAIPSVPHWVAITVDGYPQDEVAYHARLALDAELIEAKFLPGTNDFIVKRLTFAGHEFLDIARDDTRWQSAKEKVLSTAGTLTVEALKTVLTFMVQAAVKATLAS